MFRLVRALVELLRPRSIIVNVYLSANPRREDLDRLTRDVAEAVEVGLRGF